MPDGERSSRLCSIAVGQRFGAVMWMFWTAPGVYASIGAMTFGLDLFKLTLPKTAPTSFGKEDK